MKIAEDGKPATNIHDCRRHRASFGLGMAYQNREV